MKEDLYAVVDLGSTYTVGMIGKKLSNGRISPIAVHTEPSNGCIRHGCIYNIDNTATMLKRMVDVLNNQLQDGGKITSIYAGVGCQSMMAKQYAASIDLGDDGQVITQEHLQTLRDQVSDARFEGLEILYVADPLYYIDGRQEIHPQGIRCSHLEARYQLITAKRTVAHNIRYTIEEKVGIRLSGIVISPIAEAAVTLTSEEKTLGCAFVNLGGGCTTISIYQNRLLSALYVLPLGGHNVTRDLTSLRLVEADAEALKISKGSMIMEGIRDRIVRISSPDKINEREIKQLDINRLVAARMNEITFNYLNLINQSGMADSLGAGLVITGGGAKVNAYIPQLDDQLDELRVGTIRRDLIDESKEAVNNDRNLTAIGLLLLANENCVAYAAQSLDELINSLPTKGVEGERLVTEPSFAGNFPEENIISDKVITDDIDDLDLNINDNEEDNYDYEDEKQPKKPQSKRKNWARNMMTKMMDIFNADENND